MSEIAIPKSLYPYITIRPKWCKYKSLYTTSEGIQVIDCWTFSSGGNQFSEKDCKGCEHHFRGATKMLKIKHR